jgi:hypothetical protein
MARGKLPYGGPRDYYDLKEDYSAMNALWEMRATRRVARSKSIPDSDHSRPVIHLAVSLSLLFVTLGCSGAQKSKSDNTSDRVTNIAIGTTVAQSGVKRLGMNISGQNFYDSGQLLRNLVSRNPGFEGAIWQSILRCAAVTSSSCTDSTSWAVWPANFFQGATFEFIYGTALGQTGSVTSSTAADFRANKGVIINFAQGAKSPAVGDFLVVRKTIPGNAQAGWWTNSSGGGTFSTEFSDLAPDSPGKQALKITASNAGQSAELASYFGYAFGHPFVLLNGGYRLHFRAKGLGGNNQIQVTLMRLSQPGRLFLSKTVGLSKKWRDYSYDFSSSENGSPNAGIALKFNLSEASALLDDVSLAPVASSTGPPTAFRDEVVSTLTTLRPGVLRWSDGANTGNSIDNVIASPFARMRAGASAQSSEAQDLALGLHEFLQLCQAVGAEPYYSMPPGMSITEAEHLIEYFAGSSSTPYGTIRAALGQKDPWTTVFPVIHLELGNEEWNAIFSGASMPDPVAYGSRAKAIFTAMRQSKFYQPDKFDLIIGSFFVLPEFTKQELASSGGYDSTAVAPYLFNNLDDVSSNEAIFGPMFAQPEMFDSRPSSLMTQQAKVAKTSAHPAKLAVYEVNLSTTGGSAQQSSFDAVVPSVAAGLTVVDHMLLMMRDLGVTNQSIYSLSGYINNFKNSSDKRDETTPLFGAVIDMGGSTNLRRPQFLAEALANRAILPTMVTTTLTGANPTWNQKHSNNDNIQIEKAHYLQTFAFSDGPKRSVIVFNLNRTEALPITFSGPEAPSGTIRVGQLTSKSITDTNELKSNVAIADTTLNSFNPSSPYSLPPFSMTAFTWIAGH